MEKSDQQAHVGTLDRAKTLFASALTSDTSFWRAEVLRNKRIDEGYDGIELLVELDVPEDAGDPPAVLQVWKNRLFTVAHEARPDGREIDAVLAVYAALFSPLVTKVRVEVLRPQRGHFEDLPRTLTGKDAQEYFSQFGIG